MGFWSSRMFHLQENSCRTLLCEPPDTRTLVCAHQNMRQNLPLSLAVFMVLDWCANNGLGSLELEQAESWKGSFCPRLIPAFQLNMKNQSVKGELTFVSSLSDFLLPYMFSSHNTAFHRIFLLVHYWVYSTVDIISFRTISLARYSLFWNSATSR